jgi:hypothetical protein
MPQIIVMADGTADQRDKLVMMRERINMSDFESRHFATQLLERLGWAVQDAQQVEQDGDEE